MRLRYHEALLLALAPPFPRLRWEAGFEARKDTSSLFELVPHLTGRAASLGSCCFSPYLHLLPLSSPCRTPASGLHLLACC
ncbi:hypothetical protein E2C01_101331 [Portunus trituberculatus]|uniref:Uncharacterized protein n=1 Tax=Portunus trituberculatus TaxID=210409 RepID=A0A5B7K9B4_PORTR|nr:hypothetical protein [Portunus trituberculatus]